MEKEENILNQEGVKIKLEKINRKREAENGVKNINPVLIVKIQKDSLKNNTVNMAENKDFD